MKNELGLDYGLEDKPNLGKSFVLGLQHLLLMFAPTILAPIVIGQVAGLSVTETGILIAATLMASGIASLIHSKGVLMVGSRLPVVVGTESFFMVPLGMIGSNGQMGAMFSTVILGALFIILITPFLGKLMKLFPPIVTGTIITMIGVYLIPIGMNMAFDVDTPGNIGKGSVALVAAVTFILIIIFNRFLKGFLGAVSIVLAMLIGYIVAVPFGLVDFAPVKEAAWFSLPKILHFGLAMPSISALLLVMLLYIITTVETIGYLSATCEVVGVKFDDKRLKGGVLGDAVGSFIGGFLGAPALTAYAQNIGAISITRVGSRHIIVWTGIIAISLGLIPKFSALVGTIPNPVLGGAMLVLFGMVAATGVQGLKNSISGNRELIIFSSSLALGLGFSLINPDALAFMPTEVSGALMTGVGPGAACAILLNLLLPVEKEYRNDNEETVNQEAVL